jgi:pimeloyl-ACP methyl ester carboxylesterase
LSGVFDGFAARELPTDRGVIHARVGGTGPPLLLLHGYPQTHLMWHATAPRLAERFTVVATDLSGYGESFRPTPAPGHEPHSKRALAPDQRGALELLYGNVLEVWRPWAPAVTGHGIDASLAAAHEISEFAGFLAAAPGA